MKRQHIIIAVVVAIVLLLVGLGVLLYGISQGGSLPGLAQATPTLALEQVNWGDIPNLEVAPPADLSTVADQIRADYPQLADLLENPELGSVYKDFYLAYQQGGQETAIALARQRGILNDKDEIEMTLVLDTEDTAPLIQELEAEGVIIKGVYKNMINIAIPVSVIEAQAKSEQPELIVQRISNLDHVIRLEVPRKANIKDSVILGQGVNVTLANEWQKQGITGQGVKVGILDLGFGGYEKLLDGELPANVTVQAFGDESNLHQEVHGTACAEIIHEMAPDAELYLAYYDGTEVAMGQAIDWLVSQNVAIISNSTGSNGLTPMDGTGLVESIVDQVHDAGIFWVNAAGNEADVHYRGTFTDSDGDTLHEFAPDVQVLPFIPFGPGVQTEIIMSWNDWQTVDQDYDLALLDKDGKLLAKSEESQEGQKGQLPIEGFVYEFEDNAVYLLAIQNYNNAARGDAVFDIFIHGGLMHPDFVVPEYSLGSPSDAQGAFAVGAVNWADDVLEPYSSQGPTADGRIKPDLSAPSVVDSASYSPDAFNGTSAAAPHVAGAAALVLQAFPDYTPDDIAAFLQGRSLDLGPAGADNGFGVGRLSLGDAPSVAPVEETPPPLVEGGDTTDKTPTEEAPAEVVDIRPTSTPRPPEAAAPVGLPVRPGEPGLPGTPPTQEESGSLAMIIWLGLCMVCLAGLMFLVVIVGAVAVMRRRK